MSKKSIKKGIKSLERQIGAHRKKQEVSVSPELFHYYEKEILKFEMEKKKKQARV